VTGGDDFVGTGWAFPIRTDPTGRIALASREEKIEQSIRLIMATAPGERPMRPEFGCGIHDHVFASANAGTIGRMGYEVRAALRRWEPRIDVRAVDIEPDPDERSRLLIQVRYTIRSTNDPRNLVFPFYVIPEERSADRQRSGAGTPPSSVYRSA
jgi:phage baseplate assembly protein W